MVYNCIHSILLNVNHIKKINNGTSEIMTYVLINDELRVSFLSLFFIEKM